MRPLTLTILLAAAVGVGVLGHAVLIESRATSGDGAPAEQPAALDAALEAELDRTTAKVTSLKDELGRLRADLAARATRIGVLEDAAAALAAPASAQIMPGCLGDDGFNVGCCNTPQPNLPQFPPYSGGGLWGCIKDCNLDS